MILKPRPYQQAALDALHEHICTKETNPCVVIPTGGGKSALIAWIIRKWKSESPHVRIIILAHRKELIEQNAAELQGMCPEICIGIYSASLRRRDHDTDVLFASIDSIYKRSGDFPPWDVAMVDEAHRIPIRGEGKYRTFLQGCRQWNPALRVIGWTATPFRMGCGSICHKDHLLNEICYEVEVTSLIRDGYLCQLRSKVGVIQPKLEGVKRNSNGEYIIKSLAEATNKRTIIAEAVAEAVRIINTENRKSAVFFCVDVSHCNNVSKELQRHGIYAPVVTGCTNEVARNARSEAFKTGKLRAICNVNVYAEGFNATCVDCIVLLRPTLSAGLFSQMVGRGLRLYGGKEFCLVLDFAGCIEEHGPIDMLGNDTIKMAVCGACRESFSRAAGVCPSCGWEIPRVVLEKMEAADREKRMHEAKVSQRSILSDIPEVHEVHTVFAARHRKLGSPDSLRVQYRCGKSMFSEWICLDHEGFAGTKAKRWWEKRFGLYHEAKSRRAATVNEALAYLFLCQGISEYTKTITVKRKGRNWEVIAYNEEITKTDKVNA